jgi:hypothetical protein
LLRDSRRALHELRTDLCGEQLATYGGGAPNFSKPIYAGSTRGHNNGPLIAMVTGRIVIRSNSSAWLTVRQRKKRKLADRFTLWRVSMAGLFRLIITALYEWTLNFGRTKRGTNEPRRIDERMDALIKNEGERVNAAPAHIALRA